MMLTSDSKNVNTKIYEQILQNQTCQVMYEQFNVPDICTGWNNEKKRITKLYNYWFTDLTSLLI
jgi:hypothetical protein